MEPPLPGYYQYFWGVNAPCSRSQDGLTRVGLEPPTSGSGVRGINHQATALPKKQISFVVTAKLISVFVFVTQVVQSLYFLYTKFQASCHLVWLYSPVCVGPGRKSRRPVFSQRGSFHARTGECKTMVLTIFVTMKIILYNVKHQVSVHGHMLFNTRTRTWETSINIISQSPGSEVIKLFSCSTQLSMKFKLLKDIKIVGIKVMFTPQSLKSVIYPVNKCWPFNIYEQDKSHAQLS